MIRPVSVCLCLYFLLPQTIVVAQRTVESMLPYQQGRSAYPYYGWSSPASVLSSRVHAQAALVRATGDAMVDFAVARRIRAEAVRAELQNSVERVSAYWERRSIGEAEREKRKVDPEARRRRINSKTWKKLQLHPDINARTIATGTALNFLFYRLSATALTWDPSSPPEDFSSATLAHLALSPEILHHLQLEQSTGGQPFVFRADEGVPLQVDWWPYALRDAKFTDLRQAFVDRRSTVIEDASDGEISTESLEALELASVNLSTEFRSVYNRTRRLQGGTKTFREYRDGELFLRSMDLEIARLQRTGDASCFGTSLRFAPDESESHLPALLSFMSRNGLKFASPRPGEESAYSTTFNLLRDFYLAYDDSDEGINVPKGSQPSS